ncbi:MAG TPA: SelB C-terminal domain-containing protein, partial [Ktedonobacteraceae bacterium]
IVDVPGHESFIKNMLAGVGGIDAALLVIAADEGIMPQTREHLAILDLLRVQRGIVALTKADLVDEEWLELVREEVAEYLLPTTLAHSPIVSVSAYTMQGIPELLAQLEKMLDIAQERQNIARPRLPVDRVFTLTGFGTVVTGTLLDGNFKIGQEVEILPQGLKTRIRGLQTHRHKVDTAQPGTRVAMNLASVSRTDLARGDVVALPTQLRPTLLVDAHIQLLPDAPRSLAHNTQVDFYSGSQEVPARVRLLDVEELQPGQRAWVQLRLSRPSVLARRDRFILRIPSPSTTIGGGEIVDMQPRYHRRFQPAVLTRLETLELGVPEELVLAALDRRTRSASTPDSPAKGQPKKGFSGYELAEIIKQSNLATDVTQQTLETLLLEGRARRIGTTWFAQPVWDAVVEETVRLLNEQHRQYPLRSGLSKEEWRTRLNLSSKMAVEIFATLQAEGVVAEATATSSAMRLPHFIPSFNQAQQQQVEQLLQRFREHPYTPPGRSEAEDALGTEVLIALIEQGQLVKLGDGVLFLRETYDLAIATLVQFLREHGTITVAQARDILGATRKYILPLLEHMDTLKITRRLGDERVPGPVTYMDPP